jgi:hypothetical protein
MGAGFVNLPLGARGIFISADQFATTVGTFTETRDAGGNYYKRKTGAEETAYAFCNISRAIQRLASASVNTPLGTEVQGGGLITGFDLIYAIGTADLTSLTPALYQTTYSNDVAPSVMSPGGTISPQLLLGVTKTAIIATPIAAQALPYAVRFVLTTPYTIGANQPEISDWLELAIDDGGSSVFDLYGAVLQLANNR